MKTHRIFIAINLPEEAKKELIFFQKKWQNLPVRWTKKENLHLTLVFLGYLPEESLLGIFEKVKKVSKNHQPFSIYFDRICLGPPNKTPRMFWVESQKSRELALFKNDLEKELGEFQFKKEVREFKSHITLGRIKIEVWRQLQEKPEIEEDVKLICPVNSIEVMESQLKPNGPDYFILESIPLSQEKQ